jgi:hypothetical protein
MPVPFFDKSYRFRTGNTAANIVPSKLTKARTKVKGGKYSPA